MCVCEFESREKRISSCITHEQILCKCDTVSVTYTYSLSLFYFPSYRRACAIGIWQLHCDCINLWFRLALAADRVKEGKLSLFEAAKDRTSATAGRSWPTFRFLLLWTFFFLSFLGHRGWRQTLFVSFCYFSYFRCPS